MTSDLDSLRLQWVRDTWAHVIDPSDLEKYLAAAHSWTAYKLALRDGAPSTKRADLCFLDHDHESGCKELP